VKQWDTRSAEQLAAAYAASAEAVAARERDAAEWAALFAQWAGAQAGLGDVAPAAAAGDESGAARLRAGREAPPTDPSEGARGRAVAAVFAATRRAASAATVTRRAAPAATVGHDSEEATVGKIVALVDELRREGVPAGSFGGRGCPAGSLATTRTLPTPTPSAGSRWRA
jgi:hypothetical protein